MSEPKSKPDKVPRRGYGGRPFECENHARNPGVAIPPPDLRVRVSGVVWHICWGCFFGDRQEDGSLTFGEINPKRDVDILQPEGKIRWSDLLAEPQVAERT